MSLPSRSSPAHMAPLRLPLPLARSSPRVLSWPALALRGVFEDLPSRRRRVLTVAGHGAGIVGFCLPGLAIILRCSRSGTRRARPRLRALVPT
jgi:hypothetical protein